MLGMKIIERRTQESAVRIGFAALYLGIAFIASCASSVGAADKEDGLSSTSELRQFFPSDVQQKRIELQRSERWKTLSEKQRKKALKAIDDEYTGARRRRSDDLRDAYLPRPVSTKPSPLPMEVMRPVKGNDGELLASASSSIVRPPADLDSPVWIETLPARRVSRFPSEVLVTGTVRSAGNVKITAPADGTIDRTLAEPNTWVRRRKPLAMIVSPEMLALLQVERTTTHEAVFERWGETFKPTAVECPSDCFVTAVKTKPGAQVKRGDVLFEIAGSVTIEGTYPVNALPEHAHGLRLEVWLDSDPDVRWRAKIVDIFDGNITIRLPSGVHFPEGASWHGRLTTASSRWSRWFGGDE